MAADAHPHGPLADALIACGVEPQRVRVKWDGICQEEVLTFLDPAFPEATLAALARLYLTFPSDFVFATDALQNAFQALVKESLALAKLAGGRNPT